MSVVGIDFGTLHSKVGVARHRGIDIILNESSNRATPSLVGFGPKQRSIGESAKTQETSNFRNTIGSLKRLLGRTLNDWDVQEVEKKFLNATLIDVQGTVGTEVKYVGETATFSATQLVAMYLGKLRDIASGELKIAVSDVVIAVPGWYTDVQRRALMDAAYIAGLNPLRLINDTTATALGYGITKSDLPEQPENARHVVFVDVGHSTMSVSVVAFSKGQLTVKGASYDRHLGGRDIDFALVSHFAAEFKEKYKIDVLSNPKATFRLAAGCEKLKKVLSANAEANLNVESIMNDIDASSKLTRDSFEALIGPSLERIVSTVNEALAASGITLEQIDTIELVGGSTRMPAVRKHILEAFPGKQLSTTLNQDEAVARGATFACAMLSPVFRVRDFAATDIASYDIKLKWDKAQADPDEDVELLTYPRGNALPSSKVLSFVRTEPFELEAVYAHPESLPGGINPWIARFTAKKVERLPDGGAPTIRVKTRVNQNGTFSFESAYYEIFEEEAPTAMETDAPAGEPAPEVKKKRKVRKVEVPFVASTSSLDQSILDSYKEKEGQMHASDKLVMETEDRKNALEEYVYDMRDKLDGRYAAFVQPAEKEKLLADLAVAEDWLYTEEGEDATKSAYVSRLDALKAIGDPIAFRYKESEERTRSVASLRETINTYMAQATGSEDKYAHIDAKDKQTIVEKCATVQKWLEDQIVRQGERPKNVEPILKTSDIMAKRDEIIYFATPIMSKPKPKPPVVDSTPGSGTQTPKDSGKGEQPPPPPPPKEDAEMKDGEAPAEATEDGPKHMDVD